MLTINCRSCNCFYNGRLYNKRNSWDDNNFFRDFNNNNRNKYILLWGI